MPHENASALRILVVEDEMLVALLLQTLLEEFGHRIVGPVAQLDAAIEMAEREPVDLAILDVNINGAEVYPVAATLQSRNIPFLFVTGYGRTSLREPYRNRPALQKPYRSDDLRHAIAEVVGTRGAEQARGG
jgi:CheY-like chemotaxis protein